MEDVKGTMTTGEVIRLLKTSRQNLYQLRDKGVLVSFQPYTRAGHQWSKQKVMEYYIRQQAGDNNAI